MAFQNVVDNTKNDVLYQTVADRREIHGEDREERGTTCELRDRKTRLLDILHSQLPSPMLCSSTAE